MIEKIKNKYLRRTLLILFAVPLFLVDFLLGVFVTLLETALDCISVFRHVWAGPRDD